MIRDAKASGAGTGRRLSSIFVGAALTIGLLQGRPAEARTFNVPCDDAALLAAIGAIESNGEEDVLWLAEGCTYALDFPWIVDADGGFPEGFPLTVHGRGATLSGSGQHPVLVVNPTAVLALERVTVTDGFTTGDGGAIQNIGSLTLTESSVTGSEAATGGGISNFENSRLALIRSTVSGNRAGSLGGGIRNRGGRVTLIGSTVSGNTATDSSANGGGLYSSGAARVMIANSTVTGNSSRFGAGVFSDGGATAIHNSTLAGNEIRGGGNGGALYVRNSAVKLAHSLLADSVFELDNGFECVLDLFATITATSANLIEDGSCQIEGALTGDPRLGPPAGSPAHLPLLPGSPAIDAGGNQACTGLDQRGEPRRDGDRDGLVACDLGSYEAP
jgi:hypothetical protein